MIKINANNLVSTGAYNLGLECLNPLSPGAVVLGCGSLEGGSIEQSGEVDFFTFSAQTGNEVFLTLTETPDWGGAFGGNAAHLTVFAPSGAEVVTFDSTQQQRLTLAETGTYVIKINANNIVSTGAYNLGLECLNPLSSGAVAVQCGSLQSGTVQQSAEVVFYTFTAQARDAIFLTLTETPDWGGAFGGNAARLTLFSPTLADLGINTSPLAGRSGDRLTARMLQDRTHAELVGNVSIRVFETERPDVWEVRGRGELQLAILVETMRREGFELTSASRRSSPARSTARPTSRSSGCRSTCPRSTSASSPR